MEYSYTGQSKVLLPISILYRLDSARNNIQNNQPDNTEVSQNTILTFRLDSTKNNKYRNSLGNTRLS